MACLYPIVETVHVADVLAIGKTIGDRIDLSLQPKTLAQGVLAIVCCAIALAGFAQESEPFPKAPGYQGIWFELGQKGEYGDKYSGGLGTYTAKHRPIAIHAPEANKTFFVFGAAKGGKRHLLNAIGYYDHETGLVPRPTIVHDKQGVDDPHDNASLAIDGDGHLWVFVSGRGRSRPGFKYRSVNPYDIDAFELIAEEEFTYPQPVWLPGQGFLHCFTKYTKGRELYWNSSVDGSTWTPDRKLAGMGGHYQATEIRDGVVYTAFNYHPGGIVDKRTNLYFVKTNDFGETWRTVDGAVVDTPMTDTACAALVRDYESEGRLVYMKDMQFDRDGDPVILIVTSRHHMPGPKGNPRTWTIVRWTGGAWQFHDVTTSTHNYDMGQLYISEGEPWRILGPTEPGPFRWGTGGEVALWESDDEGRTWRRSRVLTADSPLNHGYVRRPLHAHPDFYALWADGNSEALSPSRLYFTDKAAETVYRLPYVMNEEEAQPEPIGRPSK